MLVSVISNWCVAIMTTQRRARRASKVIPQIDIYRAANLLIEQHGADAVTEAVKLADLMLERGDREGQFVWFRIKKAIEWLQSPRSSAQH